MNNDNINISVIIPCYNAEEFIEDALDSLSKQTFKNFEVLIIDDGSNDHTGDIVCAFKRESMLNITYCYQENSGVSSARNLGIKKARGEYITFLDADDIYSKYMLEILYNNRDEKLVTFSLFTRNLEEVVELELESEKREGINISKDVLEDVFLHRRPFVNFQTILYEKSVLMAYQIFFSSDLKYGEDNEFMWKYIIHKEGGRIIELPTYGYRIVLSSVTHTRSLRVTDAEEAIRRVITYCKMYDMELAGKMESYMLPRTKIMIAKEFAKGSDLYNFRQYCRNFDKNDYVNMKKTKLIFREKIANVLIYRFKLLFYLIINIYYLRRIKG